MTQYIFTQSIYCLNITYIAISLLFTEYKKVMKGKLRNKYKIILKKVTEVYLERENWVCRRRIDQGDL
jgi:hypothetical protein